VEAILLRLAKHCGTAFETATAKEISELEAASLDVSKEWKI
jgi:hypothetical protein